MFQGTPDEVELRHLENNVEPLIKKAAETVTSQLVYSQFVY